jgi:hypothetical protein
MHLLAIGKKSCFKTADINGAAGGITGRSKANASAGEARTDPKQRNSEMHSNVLTKSVLLTKTLGSKKNANCLMAVAHHKPVP